MPHCANKRCIRRTLLAGVRIPAKPPTDSGINPPGDSGVMPPTDSDIISPGAPGLLAIECDYCFGLRSILLRHRFQGQAQLPGFGSRISSFLVRRGSVSSSRRTPSEAARAQWRSRPARQRRPEGLALRATSTGRCLMGWGVLRLGSVMDLTPSFRLARTFCGWSRRRVRCGERCG